MDVAHALADLAEISKHLRAVVLLGPDGRLAGSTGLDEVRSRAFGDTASELVARADRLAIRDARLQELEIETAAGSLFLVRERDWVIAATTRQGAPAALVRYDLRACLRDLVQDGENPDGAADEPAATTSDGSR